MSRRQKKPDYADGTYYLTIKSVPNDIALSRKEGTTLSETCNRYILKSVTWHGRWQRKKFVETEIDELHAA